MRRRGRGERWRTAADTRPIPAAEQKSLASHAVCSERITPETRRVTRAHVRQLHEPLQHLNRIGRRAGASVGWDVCGNTEHHRVARLRMERSQSQRTASTMVLIDQMSASEGLGSESAPCWCAGAEAQDISLFGCFLYLLLQERSSGVKEHF